jgi:hypothetical protein
MEKYIYPLCDGEGCAVLDIESGFTNLSYDAYFKKHIVPVLHALSESHGTRVYLNVGGSNLQLVG